MKNKILTFLLGGLVFISLAASTTNFMTVKPAKPVSVLTYWGTVSDCQRKIIEYSNKGYVFKHSSQSQGAANGQSWTTCLIVMEKY